MPSMRKPRDTRNRPDRKAAATNRPHTNAIDRTAEAATNQPPTLTQATYQADDGLAAAT